ncbi:MAG: 3-methyladenine DNA glycosylase [Gammaproteobacteria bacterium]|nr:MAG: 3-methyladenine DNA glycosylase [Gammaproteobacteria bacterium]
METLAAIEARAARRKGGRKALEALLPQPRPPAELRRLGSDEILEEMCRAVFRSGFVWQIVAHKWPGMREALHAFDPVACAYLSDEAVEALLSDGRVIRHLRKLLSVRDNAALLLSLEQEHGSAAAWLADWPESDLVGLLLALKKRGSRLGGRTGQFFLRAIGKDTFCLTRDVVGALVQQGVIDREPASQRALREVQAAFNQWRAESGRPLCQISRILACSIDG